MTLSDVPLGWLIGVGAGITSLGVAAYFGIRFWNERRARHTVDQAFQSVSIERLTDVLVPDDMGGSVHMDALLKTSAAIVVIDLRDIAGLIFGSEQMAEWAVMQKNWRYTFANPLGPLQERLSVVRGLVGEQVTVEGLVVFTDRGSFPKGYPPLVTRLSSLQTALSGVTAITESKAQLDAAWALIQTVATKSPILRRY